MELEKSNKLRFFLLVLAPTLIGTTITLGIWFVYLLFIYFTCGKLYKLINHLFCRILLPSYIRWQVKGDKFLIRFDDQKLPDVNQRRQRWNHAGQISKTAVLLLISLIAVLAQSNINTATTGEDINAYRCPDGSVELRAGSCAMVDDFDTSYPVCTDGCSSELSAAEKISSTFVSRETIILFFFIPYVTAIIAPLMVLKYSSLAIVDKKTKLIIPIGKKLTDITNAVMGFSALLIFGKAVQKISQNAATSEETVAFLMYMSTGMVFSFIWLFYPTIWMASAKFAKIHPQLVRELDASITLKSGIKSHYRECTDEGLTILPTSTKSTILAIPNSLDSP